METAFYAFGTFNSIQIDTPLPDSRQRDILARCFGMASGLDDLLSAFKPGSEISAIAQNAGVRPVKVSDVTLALLERALYFSRVSFGAFDVTVRPALKLWKFGDPAQRLPSDDECRRAADLVNYRDLVLDSQNRTAYLKRRGQGIDLGGIAKGYAADLIAGELRNEGVACALLNFGGTICTIGTKQDGSPRRIGIQNPLEQRGRIVGSIPLADGALVTSAVNERSFIKDGVRFHHLLDPRTCFPARSGVLSVSAAGTCAEDLDALTTALFVLGPERGIPLADRLHTDALFLMEGGDMLGTEGFATGRYQFTAKTGTAI
ncbi:MAG: FAD:protein FMN transferase [Lachnospiraceae bacterium]|jgi:thiamine biosynthesis lipoprotein|nr:FAD:protein FMN transferase [Lachnospiraceae bacterium]